MLSKRFFLVTNEIPQYPTYEIVTADKFEVQNKIECEICKDVMGFLEKELKNNKSEDEIKRALEKVCKILPKETAAKCDNFVKEYVEIVIELITQEVSPKDICKRMELCEPETAVKKIRGIVFESDSFESYDNSDLKEMTESMNQPSVVML